MEQWNDLIGKEVKVIFEDGENHFSKKHGLVISVNETHLQIRVFQGEGKADKNEWLLLIKILRVEEVTQ